MEWETFVGKVIPASFFFGKMKKKTSVVLAILMLIQALFTAGCGNINKAGYFKDIDCTKLSLTNSDTGELMFASKTLFGTYSGFFTSELKAINKKRSKLVLRQHTDSLRGKTGFDHYLVAYGKLWYSIKNDNVTDIYCYDPDTFKSEIRYSVPKADKFCIAGDFLVYSEKKTGDLYFTKEDSEPKMICEKVYNFGAVDDVLYYSVVSETKCSYKSFDLKTEVCVDVTDLEIGEIFMIKSFYGEKYIVTDPYSSDADIYYVTDIKTAETHEIRSDKEHIFKCFCMFSDYGFVFEYDLLERVYYLYRIELATGEKEMMTSLSDIKEYICMRAVSDETVLYYAVFGRGEHRVSSISIGEDPVFEYKYSSSIYNNAAH